MIMAFGKKKTSGNPFYKKFLTKSSKKQSKRKKIEELITMTRVSKNTRAR